MPRTRELHSCHDATTGVIEMSRGCRTNLGICEERTTGSVAARRLAFISRRVVEKSRLFRGFSTRLILGGPRPVTGPQRTGHARVCATPSRQCDSAVPGAWSPKAIAPIAPIACSESACLGEPRSAGPSSACGPCTGRGLASRACDAAHSRPHQQAVSLRPCRACAAAGGAAADSQVVATTGGCGMGTTLGGCDAGDVRARPSTHLPSMNSCAPRGRRPSCPRKPEPARQTARRPRANEGRPGSALGSSPL